MEIEILFKIQKQHLKISYAKSSESTSILFLSFQWWQTKQGATGTTKFQLNTRKNFFTLRVMEPWTRLPKGAVDKSSSLEIFKPRLDAVLCSLLWVTLLWQGGWTG